MAGHKLCGLFSILHISYFPCVSGGTPRLDKHSMHPATITMLRVMLLSLDPPPPPQESLGPRGTLHFCRHVSATGIFWHECIWTHFKSKCCESSRWLGRMLTCCCFAFGEREVQSTQPSSLRGAFGKCNPAGKAGLGEEKGDVRK